MEREREERHGGGSAAGLRLRKGRRGRWEKGKWWKLSQMSSKGEEEREGRLIR